MLMSLHRDNQTRLRSTLPASLIVVTAHDAMQLSADMAAPFLQEANFYWLTGINDPGWKVVIDCSDRHVVLVRPQRTKIEEIFDGAADEAHMIALSGANTVIDDQDLDDYLRSLVRKHSLVYTTYDQTDYHFVKNPAQKKLHARLERIFPNVADCSTELAKLRARKSDQELAVLRKAIRLTTEAFSSVRAQLANYLHEYEIEADMTAQFRRHNAHHAYEPIIASGINATTLHYAKNNARLRKNNLVLIDVGARVEGYAADITRTYCVTPTKRQRQVHAAVRRAHERCIALLRPGLAVADYGHSVDEIMKDALAELGLFPDRSDDDLYRRYFPHAISHGLGIDVHDRLGGPVAFEPGMVITVEPGIYIPEEAIGVRLEDDIVITASGATNMSATLSLDL